MSKPVEQARLSNRPWRAGLTGDARKRSPYGFACKYFKVAAHKEVTSRSETTLSDSSHSYQCNINLQLSSFTPLTPRPDEAQQAGTHPYVIPPYKISNEASKTFWLGQMEPWMGEILRAARLRNLDRSQAFYTSVLA